MSIRILPEDEIKQAASSFYHPPLLFANPKNLYMRRIKRLRQLAEDNPFEDYLKFIAHIVEIQLKLLERYPIAKVSKDLTACLDASQGIKPLNAVAWKRSTEWIEILRVLIKESKSYLNQETLPILERLEKKSITALEDKASRLLNADYDDVNADESVFLWTALSLYWIQLAQQLPRNIKVEYGEERHLCPVCGSPPVASVVHFGETQGLRYLHCSLCESEWNMVRVKCTNCEQTGKLDYWSIHTTEAGVVAESCEDCESYLKIMYQDRDPYVEPIADDIGTIMLDEEMNNKGFARSGLNPFLFG